MRSYNSDRPLWHFVPVTPGDGARVRRVDIIIISFLAFLVVGLFLALLVPPLGNSSSAATNKPSSTPNHQQEESQKLSSSHQQNHPEQKN
jgi:predicted PurR-regulated permease PerM